MAGEVPRADRVVLGAAVTYRVRGDEHWFQSRILNISESGVLFGPTDLRTGTQIELMFSTPVSVRSVAPGRLLCTGDVVRRTDLGDAAAQFRECRFVVES